MDLTINNLPDDVGRKIKALTILTGQGVDSLRALFAEAIVEKLNVALHEAVGSVYSSTPNPTPAWEGIKESTPVPPTPKVARIVPARPKPVAAPSFVEGLGDEDDSPNPEEDDDNLFTETPIEDDDLIEKDFGVVPDDMEDDDALYADAQASYSGARPAVKAPPRYVEPGPALATQNDQMNFFAEKTGLGFAATSNRRATPVEVPGARPASLPSDAPMMERSRKPRGPRVSVVR